MASCRWNNRAWPLYRTDHDGYGNACDADLNNNGFVNATDLGLFKAAFGMGTGQSGFNPAADFNADGIVNVLDLGVFKPLFGTSPGPSALHGQATAPVLYYIHTDHLNTPRALASPTGGTVWQWMPLDPFGSNHPEEDPDGNGERVTLNLRFPGQYFDRETGLHYNYYRDYDPQTGRYLQADPIGLAGGTNLYGYVGSMPIRFVDPYGLDVGEPGFGESFIPVWGSGRQAINDFQTGHYIWGSVNSVAALSDAALVGYGVKALCKGAWKLGSHTWGATRKWYGKTRELAPNTPVHHWAIAQGGWGKQVPDIIKNQPWNLNPMPDWSTHANIHGYGPDPYNAVGKWWYGTPNWAKIGEGSLAGKAANSLRDDECNCAQ
jgi:RHS repeat-associated protein